MSKIPKLPKGQSRPASPEPSPNSLNDNNTPNMQVLHPRSSSLSRASSVRRSFIRAPKPRGLPPSSTPPQKSGSPPRGLPPSSTPPQKSGSPPPAAVGSSPAKRLPPSGLPTSMVTPPRTGLPPKGIPSASVPIPTASLPPSGLPTLGGASKNDSPNSKLLSPNPIDSDHKLSSPSSRKSSFSRNSPLRTSRIPRKNSLPPQPNTSTDSSQEAAESVSSDQSDDMAGSITSLDGSSRNSSPIPSNISKIPTVNGSAISTSSRRCEILKSRRLKYPALWNMGAPNYFSERDDMSGNTSLEMLRLGVEELETRVTSLECQMGIQNTELLYNSDDEDKSPQGPNARMHDVTEAKMAPSQVNENKSNVGTENANLTLDPLEVMYTYQPTFSLQDLQNVSKAFNWDMDDHILPCHERSNLKEHSLLGVEDEPTCQGKSHITEDSLFEVEDEPTCQESSHFTEDSLLEIEDEPTRQGNSHFTEDSLLEVEDEPTCQESSYFTDDSLLEVEDEPTRQGNSHFTEDYSLTVEDECICHITEDGLLEVVDEPTWKGSSHFTEDYSLTVEDECTYQGSSQFTEDSFLEVEDEPCYVQEIQVPSQVKPLSISILPDNKPTIVDLNELTLDKLEILSLPDEVFNVTEEDISNACDWEMENSEDTVAIQEDQPDENIEIIDSFEQVSNCKKKCKEDLGQNTNQYSNKDLYTGDSENKTQEFYLCALKSTTKHAQESVNEFEFIDPCEISNDTLNMKSGEYATVAPVVSMNSAINKPGEIIVKTITITLLAIPCRIRNILLTLEKKIGVRLIESFLKKSTPHL